MGAQNSKVKATELTKGFDVFQKTLLRLRNVDVGLERCQSSGVGACGGHRFSVAPGIQSITGSPWEDMAILAPQRS